MSASRGQRAIGLDVGHSAVKVAVDNESIIFPAVVVPAFDLADENSARRAAVDRVRAGKDDFFVGETAVIQGGMSVSPGLYDEWVMTQEHDALLLAGRRKAVGCGASESDLVVLGLPARLYSRYRAGLRERASALLETEVMVMPQPFGPFSLQVLDAEGVLTAAHRLHRETWAVIEIGYYTTDFAMIKAGVWVDSKAMSCRGVSVAAERLRRILSQSLGLNISMVDADEMLRSQKLKFHGEERSVSNEVSAALKMLTSEIKDQALALFGSEVHSFDGVIVTGGGAGVVFDDLRTLWPKATQPENPRFSVAEGLRRQGLLKIRLDRESKEREGH